MDTRRTLFFIAVSCVACVFLCGCTGNAPPSPEASGTTAVPLQTSPSGSPDDFTLQVERIIPGTMLPARYACTGDGESPEVSWTHVPEGTESLVLILEDPDAPIGTFTHWIVYDIPPDAGRIPPAVPAEADLPGIGTQGKNTRSETGYAPPCPPPGSTHRYVFRLYAVDSTLGIPGADRGRIDQAMSGHVTGQAEVTMMFGR